MLKYLILFVNLLSCYGNTTFNSLVLTGYGSNGYPSESVETYIKEIKDLNLNTASFLYTCYTANETSTNINCSGDDTPTLKSLSNAIKRAKEEKLSVSVRHYIDLKNGRWRCNWNPKDLSLFFSTYQKEIISFSKYLQKENVDLFIIGSEYCNLTIDKNLSYWTKIIASIRNNFTGKITYAANTNLHNGMREYQYLPFWEHLDFIGLNHYASPESITTQEEYKDFQKNAITEYVGRLNRVDKGIIITEFGIPGVHNGIFQPYQWINKGKSDEEQQAFGYRTILNLFKHEKKIHSISIWRKNSTDKTTSPSYNPNETDYELWHRKAWYEIQKHFKKN